MDVSTPLDVRLGLTQPDGIAHRLRWGIIGSGPCVAAHQDSAGPQSCLSRRPQAKAGTLH
jgi:hypothetical protein